MAIQSNVRTTSALRIYLDDHLAGAASGARLAHRIARRAEGTAQHPALHCLVEDIEADRLMLVQVRTSLGMHPRTPKEIVGLATEFFSRLKFRLVSRRDPGAARLLEFEMLGLGILGKLSMWRALGAAYGARGLDRFDFEVLQARVEAQHAVVEAYRIGQAEERLTEKRR